jgi:niacin transporter
MSVDNFEEILYSLHVSRHVQGGFQMKNENVLMLTISSVLIAVGVIIPMFSPVRVIIEPASFTLASHVVIFVAMFISIKMAAAVSVGTTLGFFLAGFPIVVVMRAATHVIFATIGSFYLLNVSKNKLSAVSLRVFSFFIGVIHGVFELIVVTLFYFGDNVSPALLEHGFFVSVVLLVGVGSVIHSMVDFEIARIVILPLKKQKSLAPMLAKS